MVTLLESTVVVRCAFLKPCTTIIFIKSEVMVVYIIAKRIENSNVTYTQCCFSAGNGIYADLCICIKL